MGLGVDGVSGLIKRDYSVVLDLLKKGEISEERFETYKTEFKAREAEEKEHLITSTPTGLGNINVLKARTMLNNGDISERTFKRRVLEIGRDESITAVQLQVAYLLENGETEGAHILEQKLASRARDGEICDRVGAENAAISRREQASVPSHLHQLLSGTFVEKGEGYVGSLVKKPIGSTVEDLLQKKEKNIVDHPYLSGHSATRIGLPGASGLILNKYCEVLH